MTGRKQVQLAAMRGQHHTMRLYALLLPLLNAAAAALSLAPPHGRDEDLVPVDGARVGVVAAVRVLPGEVGDLFFRIFFFFF